MQLKINECRKCRIKLSECFSADGRADIDPSLKGSEGNETADETRKTDRDDANDRRDCSFSWPQLSVKITSVDQISRYDSDIFFSESTLV